MINTNVTHTQSIWKQLQNGEWKLFYDIEHEDKDVTTDVNINKPHTDLLGKKILKLGSLVMTPKGIGRLIKLEEKLGTILFLSNNVEERFEENLISSDFTIMIRVYDRDVNNWYRIHVPANGSTETLKRLIEDLKIIDIGNTNYYLIYNGNEIKEDVFFDQIDLRTNSKILLCALKMSPCKLTRFNVTYNWWYTYASDGITFSTNKKIKLSGLALYGSHESKIQTGTLKVFEGTVSNLGQVLYDEPVEVPAAPDQASCVMPIHFKKAINIKPQIDYTIQLACVSYCYLYYGSGGKATIEGEKGVEFNFKYTLGSSHGSSVESGNYPEFYYYA